MVVWSNFYASRLRPSGVSSPKEVCCKASGSRPCVFQWSRRPLVKVAIMVNTSTVVRSSGRGSIIGDSRPPSSKRLAWWSVGTEAKGWSIVDPLQESLLCQCFTQGPAKPGWTKAEYCLFLMNSLACVSRSDRFTSWCSVQTHEFRKHSSYKQVYLFLLLHLATEHPSCSCANLSALVPKVYLGGP